MADFAADIVNGEDDAITPAEDEDDVVELLGEKGKGRSG